MARPFYSKTMHQLQGLLGFHKNKLEGLSGQIRRMEREKAAATEAGRTTDANKLKRKIKSTSRNKGHHQRKIDEIRKEMGMRPK